MLGSTIHVSWQVGNQSDFLAARPFAPTWADHVYLASQPILQSFFPKTLLGSVSHGSLDPRASYTASKDVTIPADAVQGERWLVIVTDGDQNVIESNRTDSFFAVPITIGAATPVLPAPAIADLNLTAASAPATATLGQTLRVEWTVANQGGKAASAVWSDAVYLSQDATLDPNDALLVSRSVGAHAPLATGDDYTHAENVTIPATTSSATCTCLSWPIPEINRGKVMRPTTYGPCRSW